MIGASREKVQPFVELEQATAAAATTTFVAGHHPAHGAARSRVGATFERLPLVVRWALALPLFMSCLVDIPATLDLGPLSAGGALTVVYVGAGTAGLIALGRYPKRLVASLLPFLGLLVWACFRSAADVPDMRGAQNGFVYALFPVLALLAGAAMARYPEATLALLDAVMRLASWLTIGLVAINLVTRGVPGSWDKAAWFIGPRPFALFGIAPLSWHLAHWYYDRKRAGTLALLWLAAVALTLSRTMLVVGMAMLTLVFVLQLRFRPRRVTGSIVALTLALATVAGLLAYPSPLSERMYSGDTSIEVGGVHINAEGRLDFWRVTLESIADRPYVGKGLGSSQVVIDSNWPGLEHPHNDYLRIWHDLGLVGLCLFVLALGSWVRALGRRWWHAERRREAPSAVRLAGGLALLALMGVMLTDNAVIYSFVMGPIGALVGAGLGSTGEGRRTPAGGAW